MTPGVHKPRAGLLVLLVILYAPFLITYGYGYRHVRNRDLPSFHSAARAAFSLHKSPYDPELLKKLFPAQPVYPYLYPPPTLLLVAPLSLVSYEHARLLVLVLNHALAALLLWLLVFRVPDPRRALSPVAIAVVVAYFVTFHPLTVVFAYGQLNLVAACALCLAWACLRAERSFAAALCLALAVMAKTYPALILAFLLLARRVKPVVQTVLVLAALSVAALVVVPWEAWAEWFREVLPRGGYGETPPGLFHPAAIGNQSINGFLSRLFTQTQWSNPITVNPALAKLLTYAAALAVLAASAWAVHRAWRRDAASALDDAMCVGLPAMVLIAPFSWDHHLVFVLPVATLLLGRLADGGRGLPLPLAAIILVGAIVMAPEYTWRFHLPAVLCIWGAALYLALADKAPAAAAQPVHVDGSPG